MDFEAVIEDQDLLQQIREIESKPAILNLIQLKKCMDAYRILKEKLPDYIGVSVVLHKPIKCMGSVTMEGAALDIGHPDWLIDAIQLADDLVIYSPEEGLVRVTLYFFNLTIAIK